jgi:diguanylate cyclase (GGDEF)-like protein
MPMPPATVFIGYEELIRKPLEQADPRSFTLVRSLLEKAPGSPGTSPFSYLIKAISSVVISPQEAQNHWKKIMGHKRQLELKLCRTVAITTAVIDYFNQLGIDSPLVSAAERTVNGAGPSPSHPEPGADGSHAGGTSSHQERLREEMLRAKRYKHALSVVLFNIDPGPTEPGVAEKALAVTMKLINKTVRTVDFLSRHTHGCFLLILPNTNKREALELAERLENNICQRVKRIPELSSENVRITIALGQCTKEDTAAGFIKRLEHLAETAESPVPAAIRILE